MSSHLKKKSIWVSLFCLIGVLVCLGWAGLQTSSATGSYVDNDLDGIDDSWEWACFGSLAKNGTADTDGDGLVDLLEYQLGFNPNNTDSNGDGLIDSVAIPGHLSREVWYNVPGANMADLRNSLAFAGPADDKSYLRGSDIVKNLANDYIMRVRGRVTAPISGYVRFTLEGKTSQGLAQNNTNVGHSMELWLGDNETGTSRRRVISSPGPLLNPTFSSEWIRMEQGQEYFVEVLMKAGLGTELMKLKWEYQGQALQLIPEANLRSWIPDASDTDGDGMNDAFEQRIITAGLNDVNGSGQVDLHDVRWDDDFNNNGMSNGQEWRWGLDPTAGPLGLNDRIGHAGYLSLEIWNGIPGVAVSDLTGSPAFAGAADTVLFPMFSGTPDNYADNYGMRMRGRIIAPVSGAYVFSLAGAGDGTQSMQMWLGTNGSETSRQLVVAPNGQGGVTSTLTSQPIQLVAGKEYYVEVLMKAGVGADLLDLRWQYPGQTAQLIPATNFRSYVPSGSDSDHDGMLDEAEFDHFGNLSRDGAGDADGDGASDLTEFQAGSDPNLAASIPGDIDGDGLLDAWETLHFGNLGHSGTGDTDGDGYNHAAEQAAGSDPNLAASVPGEIDADGLPDAWELLHFNGLIQGPGDDPDGDGFDNAAELAAGSDPNVGASTPNDVDGDGLLDSWEVLNFGNLAQGPGHDPDGDNYDNAAEFAAGSNPNLASSNPGDLDGDSLPDAWEMQYFGNLAQTRNADPDGDGFSNYGEFKGGTNPASAGSYPQPAGAVSINVGGNGSLTPTEAAGINARTNWNDVTNIVNPGYRLAKNSAGKVVPGMFFSATGRNNSFNSLGTPDKKMMSSWMEQPTINLTGIPYSSYKIIVYYDSNAQLSVGNSSVMSFALRSGGTSLSTLYGVNKKAFRLEPNVNPNWDRFQATTLTAANAEVVNGDGGFHLIFEGLSARDLTLQVATVSGTPAGISGIEIVYNEDFLDEDSDGLPDAWEIATYGNLNQGASADSDLDGLPDAWEQTIVDTFGNIQSVASVQPWDDQDRDGLTNRQEYDGGTNPAVGDSIPQNWMVEHWDGIALDGVASLVLEDKFYDPADRWHLASTNSFVDMVATSGVRMRGKIVAPQTGYYYFWLSCRNGGELWLSDNGTKFRKRKIAELSPEVGSGYGITVQNTNRWDQFATQMSEPVYLVAGQSYYMEILNQNGHVDNRHVSIAWARPGAAREALPVSVLSSYAPEAADRDDDSLLDSWEAQYGLNPNDNGGTDRSREGERGDFDGDGLSNLEEQILGTNPANVDTDSDGINDRDEVRAYGTNPNVSDAPAETVVNTVALGSVVSSVGNWSMISSGLISDSFRGSVEWNFTVPAAGDWIIHVETGLMGTLRDEEIMDVEAKIDGTFLTRRALIYGPDRSNLLRLVVPGLSAGTHRLALNFDNFIGRRTVVIKKVEVRQPSGIDANSDGRMDWVAAELASSNHVVPHAATSPTSPFCLEGNSTMRSSIMVNGVAATAGSDRNHWFRNVPLNSNGTATSYAVTSGNGFQASGAVTWTPTNVLDTPEITIRRGDSLRLGAWIANGTGTATINVSGTNLSVSGTGSVVRAFNTGGSFNVTATHSSGLVKTMVVNVRFATLPKGKMVMANSVYKYRITTSQAYRGLFFDGGKDLRLGLISDVSSTNYDLVLYPEWGGTYGLLARLYQGGPILDVAPIFGISASDALQNELTTATTAPGQPGYVILTTPVVVKNIPPGGRVVIDIARAGVTFLDGTKQKIFYQSDFENDLIVLQFLAPADLSGGYCHTLKVQDANGVTVQ